MTTTGPHCDFFGCDQPLAPDQPKTGMKFCVEHDRQFEEIAKEEPFSPRRLLRFWIDAQGGTERAAHRMIHGDDS